MTNLDEHITRVLHHHADDTAIENNLDVIVSDGNIVRFATTKPTSTRRTPQLFAAAAAAIMVVAGGLAITQLGPSSNETPAASNQNEPTPEQSSITAPGAPIFPVLDRIPDRFGTVSGIEVTFLEPYNPVVALGRIDGDRLIDVTTVTAAPIGVDGGIDLLIPSTAQLDTDTVGGRQVDVYRASPPPSGELRRDRSASRFCSAVSVCAR